MEHGPSGESGQIAVQLVTWVWRKDFAHALILRRNTEVFHVLAAKNRQGIVIQEFVHVRLERILNVKSWVINLEVKYTLTSTS